MERSGEQWWRSGGVSGESTRLSPMWPGFDFQIWCQMGVEFVGSLFCSERFKFFPGNSGFPLFSKTFISLYLI